MDKGNGRDYSWLFITREIVVIVVRKVSEWFVHTLKKAEFPTVVDVLLMFCGSTFSVKLST